MVMILFGFTFGEQSGAVLNHRLNNCHHLDRRRRCHVKQSSFPGEEQEFKLENIEDHDLKRIHFKG